jgi:hypothetical protein
MALGGGGKGKENDKASTILKCIGPLQVEGIMTRMESC